MAIIGVTGTYGKTSMCLYLEKALLNAGATVRCFANEQERLNGVMEYSMAKTTPVLQQIRFDTDHTIIEITAGAIMKNALYDWFGLDFLFYCPIDRCSEEDIFGNYTRYLDLKKKAIRHIKPGGIIFTQNNSPILPALKHEASFRRCSIGTYNAFNLTNRTQNILDALNITATAVTVTIPGRRQILNANPLIVCDLGCEPGATSYILNQLQAKTGNKICLHVHPWRKSDFDKAFQLAALRGDTLPMPNDSATIEDYLASTSNGIYLDYLIPYLEYRNGTGTIRDAAFDEALSHFNYQADDTIFLNFNPLESVAGKTNIKAFQDKLDANNIPINVIGG